MNQAKLFDIVCINEKGVEKIKGVAKKLRGPNDKIGYNPNISNTEINIVAMIYLGYTVYFKNVKEFGNNRKLVEYITDKQLEGWRKITDLYTDTYLKAEVFYKSLIKFIEDDSTEMRVYIQDSSQYLDYDKYKLFNLDDGRYIREMYCRDERGVSKEEYYIKRDIQEKIKRCYDLEIPVERIKIL